MSHEREFNGDLDRDRQDEAEARAQFYLEDTGEEEHPVNPEPSRIAADMFKDAAEGMSHMRSILAVMSFVATSEADRAEKLFGEYEEAAAADAAEVGIDEYNDDLDGGPQHPVGKKLMYEMEANDAAIKALSLSSDERIGVLDRIVAERDAKIAGITSTDSAILDRIAADARKAGLSESEVSGWRGRAEKYATFERTLGSLIAQSKSGDEFARGYNELLAMADSRGIVLINEARSFGPINLNAGVYRVFRDSVERIGDACEPDPLVRAGEQGDRVLEVFATTSSIRDPYHKMVRALRGMADEHGDVTLVERFDAGGYRIPAGSYHVRTTPRDIDTIWRVTDREVDVSKQFIPKPLPLPGAERDIVAALKARLANIQIVLDETKGPVVRIPLYRDALAFQRVIQRLSE